MFYIKLMLITKVDTQKLNNKMKLLDPTSKIYAQKGTGGARHASRKAPILLVVVLHMDLKVNLLTKKEN